MDEYYIEQHTKSVSAAIASSKYDAAINCLMFGHGGRIFLTGHPRNDRLVDHISGEKEVLRKILPHISDTDTIILYAPTFKSEVIQTEGMTAMFFPDMRLKKTCLKIFPFDDFDVEGVHRFLQKRDIIILLRLHIGDTATKLEVAQLETSGDRIICFDYNLCPDINAVLGDIDFVVTDYSSIFYDFLLPNCPMLFMPYDLKDYENQQGLIVDDCNFWTPGPKVTSMKEFVDYVRHCIRGGPDPYEARRRDLNSIVNAHQTANTTSRILKLMKYLKKGNA